MGILSGEICEAEITLGRHAPGEPVKIRRMPRQLRNCRRLRWQSMRTARRDLRIEQGNQGFAWERAVLRLVALAVAPMTWKFLLLVRVPVEVVTTTGPVVAPGGTTAVM